VSLQFDGGLTVVQLGLRTKKTQIDIVFPAMHGTYGEDGALMGLLEMAGVPYVGCGLSASAVAMDKGLSKQIAAAAGVPVSRFELLEKASFENNPDQHVKKLQKKLTFPLFVKPVHLGSSIGITKVQNQLELTNALEVAFHYDNRAIIEETVPNLIEVTLPIMGNTDLTPALLERPLVSAEDFFDFDTKYLRGGKKGGGKKGGTKGAQGYSELPANLDIKLYDSAVGTGLAVYRALGCQGIARVDMLIDGKTGKVYFNEVNPLPGDLYRHNWQASGISAVELIEKLIQFALERADANSKLHHTFQTSYLKQF
jgi:D-alanine-D-alanine ligase